MDILEKIDGILKEDNGTSFLKKVKERLIKAINSWKEESFETQSKEELLRIVHKAKNVKDLEQTFTPLIMDKVLKEDIVKDTEQKNIEKLKKATSETMFRADGKWFSFDDFDEETKTVYGLDQDGDNKEFPLSRVSDIG